MSDIVLVLTVVKHDHTYARNEGIELKFVSKDNIRTTCSTTVFKQDDCSKGNDVFPVTVSGTLDHLPCLSCDTNGQQASVKNSGLPLTVSRALDLPCSSSDSDSKVVDTKLFIDGIEKSDALLTCRISARVGAKYPETLPCYIQCESDGNGEKVFELSGKCLSGSDDDVSISLHPYPSWVVKADDRVQQAHAVQVGGPVRPDDTVQPMHVRAVQLGSTAQPDDTAQATVHTREKVPNAQLHAGRQLDFKVLRGDPEDIERSDDAVQLEAYGTKQTHDAVLPDDTTQLDDMAPCLTPDTTVVWPEHSDKFFGQNIVHPDETGALAEYFAPASTCLSETAGLSSFKFSIPTSACLNETLSSTTNSTQTPMLLEKTAPLAKCCTPTSIPLARPVPSVDYSTPTPVHLGKTLPSADYSAQTYTHLDETVSPADYFMPTPMHLDKGTLSTENCAPTPMHLDTTEPSTESYAPAHTHLAKTVPYVEDCTLTPIQADDIDELWQCFEKLPQISAKEETELEPDIITSIFEHIDRFQTVTSATEDTGKVTSSSAPLYEPSGLFENSTDSCPPLSWPMEDGLLQFNLFDDLVRSEGKLHSQMMTEAPENSSIPLSVERVANLGEDLTVKKKGRRRKESRICCFLVDALNDPAYNPSCIRWEGEDKFRIINGDKLAESWSEKRNRKSSSFKNLARAIRHYYHKDVITRVAGKKHLYKFGQDAKKLYQGRKDKPQEGHELRLCELKSVPPMTVA